MPKSTTLALKSTVTRRQADPVAPDINERLAQLQHHQAAEAVASPAVETAPAAETEPSGKALKREAHALQTAFLSANRGQPVVCYLLNGVKLVGRLRQFDQYCILLDDQNEISSLIFKHAIATIMPASRHD